MMLLTPVVLVWFRGIGGRMLFSVKGKRPLASIEVQWQSKKRTENKASDGFVVN